MFHAGSGVSIDGMEQNQSGPAGFDRNRLQNPQSWRRSRSDRWVAGVCGGIGRALNIDPVLVRVVMAVLIISGPGVIFYIAAWILMPDEGSDRSAVQGVLGDRVRTDHPWFWPVVVGACVFFAVAMMSSFNFGRFVPGPLIVIGVIWLIAKQRKSNNNSNKQAQRPQDTVPPTASTYSAYSGYSGPQQTTAYMPPQTGPSAPPAGPSGTAPPRPHVRTLAPGQGVW
jgi:phage shock protein PspC (stress-responsive transcriptional regulator)